MERDERYDVILVDQLVVGTPATLTLSERKNYSAMFSINGWKYTLLEEISQSHLE